VKLVRRIRAVRRALRAQSGAVALEAILSILLMLGAFQVMWGAALIVYNQSKVWTGTQFAAHGALVVYDRSTYRGGYPPGSGSDGGAYAKARAAAQTLLRYNAQTGMAPDQFSGTTPQVVMQGFDVNCGNSVSATSQTNPAVFANRQVSDDFTSPDSGGACRTSQLGSGGAAVTSVYVSAWATGSYWLLNPLGNSQRGRADSDQRTGRLAARASAISVSEEARP
jgi:hypothetical protein